MKVNITLADELMQRIDSYADENYMTRSGFISLASTQYLSQQEALKLVKDMGLAMRKIADKGIVADEIIAQLEDWERMAKMIVGG